jgi:stage V sporulation protein B
MLNFFSVSGTVGFYVDIRRYLKVGIAMSLMALSGQWLSGYLGELGLPLLAQTAASIAAALGVYFAALELMRVLRRKRKNRWFHRLV